MPCTLLCCLSALNPSYFATLLLSSSETTHPLCLYVSATPPYPQSRTQTTRTPRRRMEYHQRRTGVVQVRVGGRRGFYLLHKMDAVMENGQNMKAPEIVRWDDKDKVNH